VTTGSTAGVRLTVRPLTAELWPDLEAFFGPRGAYSNCWCTWWRQTTPLFQSGCRNSGTGNRQLLHRITDEGRAAGLLGYEQGVPVGWVSLGPRRDFGRVLRSPNLKPEPGEPDDGIWSIVCFWVPRQHRRRGIGAALLDGAVAYAAGQGVATLEAYPIDTDHDRVSSAGIFTGTLEMFVRAGFTEVRRRAGKRPVVRRDLAALVEWPG
jgi:ribosomal protein S18 acetylase RimI-like enzyme